MEKHLKYETARPVTWGYHDFVFLRSDPKESQIVLGVNVPDCALGLHGQLMEKTCVLDRCRVVQGSSDRNACDEM